MKLADQNALNKLAEKQEQEGITKKAVEITEDELELLYSKATKELEMIRISTTAYKEVLKNYFYGDFIFDETLTSIFFDTIAKMVDKLLPAILEGNYDIIYNELGEDMDEKSFNQLRLEIYRNLKNRYM